MTLDEILQIAIETGLPIRTDPMQRGCTNSEIVRFAKKVAQIAIAGERDACAKVE